MTTPTNTADHLVWSAEHRGFWRPNRCGYTWRAWEAGRYTAAEAAQICEQASYGFAGGPDDSPPEVAVYIGDLPDLITVAEMVGITRQRLIEATDNAINERESNKAAAPRPAPAPIVATVQLRSA